MRALYATGRGRVLPARTQRRITFAFTNALDIYRQLAGGVTAIAAVGVAGR